MILSQHSATIITHYPIIPPPLVTSFSLSYHHMLRLLTITGDEYLQFFLKIAIAEHCDKLLNVACIDNIIKIKRACFCKFGSYIVRFYIVFLAFMYLVLCDTGDYPVSVFPISGEQIPAVYLAATAGSCLLLPPFLNNTFSKTKTKSKSWLMPVFFSL